MYSPRNVVIIIERFDWTWRANVLSGGYPRGRTRSCRVSDIQIIIVIGYLSRVILSRVHNHRH